jgi:hypothetical protein
MGNATWRNISWLYSECYLYRLITFGLPINFPDSCIRCLLLPCTGNIATHFFARKTKHSSHQRPVFWNLPNVSKSLLKFPRNILNSVLPMSRKRNYCLFVITPNRANLKSGGNGPHLFVGQCLGSFLFAAR